MTPFQPHEMLEVLVRHGVDFVVVGGAAATLHGSPQVTVDLDIVPEPGLDNLARLSAALTELGARIRAGDVPGGLPFNHDAESLARVSIWNLQTRFGELDVISEPAAMGRFDSIRARAVQILVRGQPITVASLDDIIRSKEAAGRDKDQAALPALRRLRAERGDQPDSPERNDTH